MYTHLSLLLTVRLAVSSDPDKRSEKLRDTPTPHPPFIITSAGNASPRLKYKRNIHWEKSDRSVSVTETKENIKIRVILTVFFTN